MSKIFFGQEIICPKKFGEEIDGQKNSDKKYLAKKFVGSRKKFCQKNLGSKKIFLGETQKYG